MHVVKARREYLNVLRHIVEKPRRPWRVAEFLKSNYKGRNHMERLTFDQKKEILDYFGNILINHVRDVSLNIAMDIATGNTTNPLKQKKYKVLLDLSSDQKEAICDLLSETITDTIFNFLDMFEANEDKMKLFVIKDGASYDLNAVSEKMGGEIAFQDEDGWIQKFSKVGRFTD